jgi:hypothetical protein
MNDKILGLYDEVEAEKRALEAENNAQKEKMAKAIISELATKNNVSDYYMTRSFKKPFKMRAKAFFKRLFSSF